MWGDGCWPTPGSYVERRPGTAVHPHHASERASLRIRRTAGAAVITVSSWLHLRWARSSSSWKTSAAAAAAAKSLQSCPTLCDPTDGSPRGSPVPGILQARTLEWAAISLSSAWNWKVKVKSLSLVRLLATPWTSAHQAPPSMGFSRQECWSGRLLLSRAWIFAIPWTVARQAPWSMGFLRQKYWSGLPFPSL